MSDSFHADTFKPPLVPVAPFDQDDLPLPKPVLVPSGFVWMDGRWTNPADLTLVTVIRDGLQIRRRPADLLPYDELVSL